MTGQVREQVGDVGVKFGRAGGIVAQHPRQQVVARVTIEREGGDRPACVAETVSVVVF